MINNLLAQKVERWFKQRDCPAKQIITHIQERGFLREAQIEAIKTYLFLKIEGKNTPLWQLFCEGFFVNGEDLSKLHISEDARQLLDRDKAARALFEFSRAKVNGNSKSILPDFEKYLRDHAANINCGQVIKDFEEITYAENDTRYFNELYEQEQLAARIRLAFHQKRALQTTSEIIPQSARMLLVEKLSAVANDRKLYPGGDDIKQILDIDRSGKTIEEAREAHQNAFKLMQETLKAQGLNMPPTMTALNLSPAVESKDRTFHFLPYDFTQSNFELTFLKEALLDGEIGRRKLELYYNGERNLTDFKIECHAKVNGKWQRVGEYTPNFLLLERKEDKIYRALIIETKGSGFAEQKEFLARKNFVETEFLTMNNDKFGYRRFDYLYLSDANDMADNLRTLNTAILSFFVD